MSLRYFENMMSAGADMDADGVTTELLLAAGAALKHIKACAVAHRDVSGGSIYTGVGGVGLTYLRLAQAVQRGGSSAFASGGSYMSKHSVSHCLALAESFMNEADSLVAHKRVTFLEGASGVMAVRAALCHMRGDEAGVRARVQELVGLSASRVSGVLPDGECELLYGRSGYLYSLLWLQGQLGEDVVPASLVRSLVRHILDEGLHGAEALDSAAAAAGWRLMWAWHGKRYLGAAHGVAGILYVLLHCMDDVRSLDRERAAAASASGLLGGGPPPSYEAAMVATLNALAAASLPSGNLPTKLGDREDARVAWCHGGAGFVLTMLAAARETGDPQGRFMAAAVAAGDDIWRRGLLKKGVGLCHGIAGNGYALLALARASPGGSDAERRYTRAARAFGLVAARRWQELFETPDRPASLFEGLAGAVNFWLDLVHPAHSSWPGAEL